MGINYIPVIGLEIHLQLKLNTKMFSPEGFTYGAISNTYTSPVTLACPGALPTINRDVFTSAIKLGLTCGCKITNLNYFDRKNYFYPDLPKGYQITQDKTPICLGGRIYFDSTNSEKYIDLTRIHIEEDTANIKIVNDSDTKIYNSSGNKIFIDYNRCGVALLEIVTEPEFRSPDDVYYFLHELRRLVRFLDISNGNMEEGSLRCDVNISLMEEGSNKYGQRVEVKNINSISNVRNAINYEINRQTEILDSNKNIESETRMFIPENNTTRFMRLKESSNEYHYMREYDILPVYISDDEILSIKNNLPISPREYKKKLLNEYSLTEYISDILLENIDLLHYFESLCKIKDIKAITIANWIIGPIKSLLNEYKINIDELNINKNEIILLIKLVEENKISYIAATQIVLKELINNTCKSVNEIINNFNLIQTSDEDYIKTLVNDILNEYPEKVNQYKNGKVGLLGFFIGEVMKRSEMKANPKVVNKIINDILIN